MSRPSYSVRDQYQNLNRQDLREDISDDDMQQSDFNSNNLHSTFDLYQDGIDELKSLPKCLKTIFTTLAKKHTSMKCRLLNNNAKIESLNNAMATGDFPKSVKFQIKTFEKRYTDAATISSLSEKVIDSEKTRLTQKNLETTTIITNRSAELQELLKPIINHSETFNGLLTNSDLILNALIESEFCTMILKMEKDKIIKANKKAKFNAQREFNNSPALVTTKQVKQLTNQLKTLQLKLKKQESKSKNSNGKPGKKKTDKPNPMKEGKKRNNSKKDGNIKNTRRIHQ